MSPAPTYKANTQTRAHKRKAVSFNTAVTVKECLHKNEYSMQERSSTWFNQSENMAIKLSCKRTIKMMKQGVIDMGGDDYCTRGLEKRVNRSPDFVIAIVSVLREQHHQNCMGVRDPEAISQIYQQISHQSKVAAYCTALRDAEAAMPAPLPKRAPVRKEGAKRIISGSRLASQPAIRCRAA
eukprot:CAMPEP_0198116106 /NCGR_PEP_ID=MMETSP1442-20131203/9459_1 /TAXON_ID= /ORGANISM="Craspedostauros australis, Strain CCMP3328" /LENGTH=181 /DNA_ID=CAMNT_0043773803 /DNA_START=80 /DNA_END=625 /DNA_ORIENTATION=-